MGSRGRLARGGLTEQEDLKEALREVMKSSKEESGSQERADERSKGLPKLKSWHHHLPAMWP